MNGDIKANLAIMTVEKRIKFGNSLNDLAMEINQCPAIEGFIDFHIRLSKIAKTLYATRNNSEIRMLINNSKSTIFTSIFIFRVGIFLILVEIFLIGYYIFRSYEYRYSHRYVNTHGIPCACLKN